MTNACESSFSSFHRFPKGRYGIRNKAECGVEDRLVFPAQSSVLDEEALLERVVPLYVLPPIAACRFLTRGDSDVHRLDAEDGRRFYLKAYRPPHSTARAEAEAQLAADLAANGFAAVPPVPRADGQYATAVNANEGVRPVLLWTEAPPSLPAMTPDLATDIGRTIAHLHRTCDSLPRRYDLPNDHSGDDLGMLMSYALPFMNERDGALALAAMEWVGTHSSDLPTGQPVFGICHGDLASSNIRLHPVHGVTLFDFGCSQYTWRGFDFMRFAPGASATPESEARWEGFRQGYAAVAALPQGLDETLPILQLMGTLRFLGRGAATCPLRMGLVSPEEWVPRILAELRKQVQVIPELRGHLAARSLL